MFTPTLPNVEQWLPMIIGQFLTLMLVVIRLSGLMTMLPGLNHPSIPWNLRIFIVMTLGFLITPSLSDPAAITFHELDRNQDGLLQTGEIPEQLQSRFQELLEKHPHARERGLSRSEWRLKQGLPNTLIELVWLVVGEFSLGFVLGMGVMLLLTGLQLAGQMLDQQTGVGLGSVFNPDFDSGGSLSGDALFLMGNVLFLLMGGHLLVISTLLETFRVLPVGYGGVTLSTVEVLSLLVQESLRFSLLVAAPLLATQALVGLGMGFLGHTVPQINILTFGFPIRTFVGLVVLALAFSGVADQMATSVPEVIRAIADSFTE